MVFHGRCGVEQSQGRVHLGLEGVVRAAVVQIVAEAGNKETKNLIETGEDDEFDDVLI